MAEETTNTTQTTENTQAAETEKTNAQTTETNTQPDSKADLEKLIQSAVDRATNKLGNENKQLRKQIETMQKEKMSADEIKELELKNREADVVDREAKIKEQENRFFAIRAIKEAGLDDGSNNALELVDFVMGEDEETITKQVKAFSALVKKFVAAQVDQTFKSKGRNPENSGTSESNATNNVALNIGKLAADRNAAANKVLEHYLGGKK